MTACKHEVSGTISLPSRGAFHRSFTVLFAIGHQMVFRLGGWSPRLPTGFLVSRGTLDPARSAILFTYVALTLCGRPSHAVQLKIASHDAVRNPENVATFGLASSAFARHYSRNLG